jgi:hypothetical protein
MGFALAFPCKVALQDVTQKAADSSVMSACFVLHNPTDYYMLKEKERKRE